MKKIIAFLSVYIALTYLSCSEPTSTDKGGDPNPPRWVEMSVKIDSLPAVDKTGIFQFQFIVTGEDNGLPFSSETGDSVNYIRVSFYPDLSGQRFTTMSGDTLWEGKVSYLDTIKLTTLFTPKKTPKNYFTTVGGYREFDWAVSILIGYYYLNESGDLIPIYGNPGFNNAEYGFIYVNTKTGDVYIQIEALKVN